MLRFLMLALFHRKIQYIFSSHVNKSFSLSTLVLFEFHAVMKLLTILALSLGLFRFHIVCMYRTPVVHKFVRENSLFNFVSRFIKNLLTRFWRFCCSNSINSTQIASERNFSLRRAAHDHDNRANGWNKRQHLKVAFCAVSRNPAHFPERSDFRVRNKEPCWYCCTCFGWCSKIETSLKNGQPSNAKITFVVYDK